MSSTRNIGADPVAEFDAAVELETARLTAANGVAPPEAWVLQALVINHAEMLAANRDACVAAGRLDVLEEGYTIL